MKNKTSVNAQSSWFSALPFVVGCIAVGFLGSYLGGAFKKHQWFDDSPKPSLWPPQWVFPPVWIGNYILMGLATWQVWLKRDVKSVRIPLAFFMFHLLHNFLFLPLVNRVQTKWFYVLMDTIGLSLGSITTLLFSRVSQSARLLMMPYVCWLCFTTFIKFLWWRIK